MNGDNFRLLSPEEAAPLLQDWLATQADLDRRTGERRVITAPDRVEAARATIEYRRIDARVRYERRRETLRQQVRRIMRETNGDDR